MALFTFLRARGFRATPCPKILWSGGYRSHATKARPIAKVEQKDLEQKFETWAEEFEKYYSTDAEKKRRFKIFQRNYENIQRQYQVPFCLDQFADLAPSKSGELPDMEQKFNAWANEYGKKYPSDAEKKRRFEIFKRSYDIVQRHNQDPNKSFTLLLDDSADLTPKEFIPDFQDRSYRNRVFPKRETPQRDSQSLLTETEVRAEVEEPELPQLFEKWAKHYGKGFASYAEKMYRFKIFRDKYRYVRRCNQSPEKSKVINQFSDLTTRQVQRMCCGSAGPRKLRSVLEIKRYLEAQRKSSM